MKILQLVCFPLWGSGSGNYVRKLSESLAKIGHQVAIVSPEERTLPNIKIYPVRLPFMAVFTGHPEHPDALLYSKLTGAQLNDIQSSFSEKVVQAVEDFNPDVIHVHHAANLSWIANYIKAVYQIHYLVTSHNTDVINAVLDKRYIPLTQDALNRADVITAVSDNTRHRLLRTIGKGYPLLKKKTKVVSCGVDSKLFPVRGQVKNVERRFQIDNRPLVLYSGKVTPIKGIDLFIKAADSFPEATFIIVGDGNGLSEMKELASHSKHKNIVFTGYLGSEDRKLMAELYRRADIVAVPSVLSEGVPLSALEAMSAGSVVVASNIGGIPTIIKDGRTGILVKPKSLSSLIEGIRRVLSNPRLQKRVSVKARRIVVEKYDWLVIARRLERYYQTCYRRSMRNRATKKPSFISEEEYNEDKALLQEIQVEKKIKS